MAAFAIDQNAALTICDGRRADLVKAIDDHAKVVTPRPWWAVWR